MLFRNVEVIDIRYNHTKLRCKRLYIVMGRVVASHPREQGSRPCPSSFLIDPFSIGPLQKYR